MRRLRLRSIVIALVFSSACSSLNAGSKAEFHDLGVGDCVQGSPQIENAWQSISCSDRDLSRNDQYVVTFTGTQAEANQAGVGTLLRANFDCPLPLKDGDFVVCFDFLR